MRIVIVGCGKVGSALVEQLSAEGHDIVVIDSDKETVDGMANMYDVIGIYGNGTVIRFRRKRRYQGRFADCDYKL